VTSSTHSVPLWYLPPGVPEPRSSVDGLVLRVAKVDGYHIRAARAALETAEPEVRALPVTVIVEAIDRALARLRDPTDPARSALLEAGPVETGYSREALAHAVDVMLARFGADGLWALLRDELGNPAVLDDFVPSAAGMRTARGLGRHFHVFAGTVPTVAVFSMICVLLTKSTVLAKPSSADTLFPAMFARTLSEVEPRLAPALAVLPWQGGDDELEREALVGAGAVIVYGSDETVNSFRKRAPQHGRFVGYGHRLSAAAISREAHSASRLAATARNLAWDVSLFDQRGCLSPQVAFVERGGERTSLELAAATAECLDALLRTLPKNSGSPEQSARIRSLRDAVEFRAALGEDVRVWTSPGSTAWTVFHMSDNRPQRWGSGGRVITLVPVDDLEAGVPRLCTGMPVSTIGVAATADRFTRLATRFSTIATRICPLGRMAEPPVTWRHDGRPNLLDLVEWHDLEQ
jgi:hypothetical protein